MKIEVDEFVLRQAIQNFWKLIGDPHNNAKLTLARISVETLEAHLPEVIAKYEEES